MDKTGAALGVDVTIKRLPSEATQTEALAAVSELNRRPNVDAVMVELPVPASLNYDELLSQVTQYDDPLCCLLLLLLVLLPLSLLLFPCSSCFPLYFSPSGSHLLFPPVLSIPSTSPSSVADGSSLLLPSTLVLLLCSCSFLFPSPPLPCSCSSPLSAPALLLSVSYPPCCSSFLLVFSPPHSGPSMPLLTDPLPAHARGQPPGHRRLTLRSAWTPSRSTASGPS